MAFFLRHFNAFVFFSLFRASVVCAISAKFRVLVQEFELINEGMIA